MTNHNCPCQYLKACWGKFGRKGASVAFMTSYHGFIYTVFGLGPSHTGLQCRPREKACLARSIGSSPRPNHEDHCTQTDNSSFILECALNALSRSHLLVPHIYSYAYSQPLFERTPKVTLIPANATIFVHPPDRQDFQSVSAPLLL